LSLVHEVFRGVKQKRALETASITTRNPALRRTGTERNRSKSTTVGDREPDFPERGLAGTQGPVESFPIKTKH